MNRFKRIAELATQANASAKVLWILQPTHDACEIPEAAVALEWLRAQKDALSEDPNKYVVQEGAVLTSYAALAWSLRESVGTMHLATPDTFWPGVEEAAQFLCGVPRTHKLFDYDLIILPSLLRGRAFVSMEVARQGLANVHSSFACGFIPQLEEYFDLADKFHLQARLINQLPPFFSIRMQPSHPPIQVFLAKLPCITFLATPARATQPITAQILTRYKDELHQACSPTLQQLLEQQQVQGYVLKPRFGGYGEGVHIFKSGTGSGSNALTPARLTTIFSEASNASMDFFLEPFVEHLMQVEHRLYMTHGNDAWQVDTYSSQPGFMANQFMKQGYVTDVAAVRGSTISFSVSLNPTKAAMLLSAAQHVKAALVSGRGLLFNTVVQVLLRVDMCCCCLVDGTHVVVVNEVDQFNTGWLYLKGEGGPEQQHILKMFKSLSEQLQKHIKLCIAERKNLTGSRKMLKGQ